VSQDFQILAGSGAWPTAAMRFAPDAKNLAKKWVARYAYFAFPPQHFLHCGITADAVSVFCFLAGQQAFGQIKTSDIVGTVSDATGAAVMNAKVGVTVTANKA
jgi:hypothetical protein